VALTPSIPRVPPALSRVASSIIALAMMLLARPTHAQSVAPVGRFATDSVCSYRTCALTIAPRWNGLAVVAGEAGPRLANLHFLVPRNITAVLAGPHEAAVGADSAAAYARRAVQLRRAGAALTDAGLLLGAVAALHALDDDSHRRRDAQMAGVGGAALLLSIPLQFAADGALSRAVWWHNLRYVR